MSAKKYIACALNSARHSIFSMSAISLAVKKSTSISERKEFLWVMYKQSEILQPGRGTTRCGERKNMLYTCTDTLYIHSQKSISREGHLSCPMKPQMTKAISYNNPYLDMRQMLLLKGRISFSGRWIWLNQTVEWRMHLLLQLILVHVRLFEPHPCSCEELLELHHT